MVCNCTLALVLVIVAQVVLFFWALSATNVMKEEWPHVVKATPADVYVVQSDIFLGPVWAIIPRRCREMDMWRRIVEKGEEWTQWVEKGEVEASPTTVIEGLSSNSLGDQVEQRRLARTIKVMRCNETMEFQGASFWQRYFSMITLGRVLYGEHTHAFELHAGRLRLYNGVIIGYAVSMVLKYTMKVSDIMSKLFGYQYEQLWNQGRPTFDKAVESLLFHGSNIVFTLSMQMTMCCLFLSFWREDHFEMLHVPGTGFVMFLLSLVFFQSVMVLDRCMSWMARCQDWYIYAFWTTYFLWAVIVNIPMIGYCIYSVNFMWQVQHTGWLAKEKYIFSDAFVHASTTGARAMGCFLGVAVVDMVVIIMLDLTHHST